VADRFAGFRSV
jgi:AcrR family transcriptional regulator